MFESLFKKSPKQIERARERAEAKRIQEEAAELARQESNARLDAELARRREITEYKREVSLEEEKNIRINAASGHKEKNCYHRSLSNLMNDVMGFNNDTLVYMTDTASTHGEHPAQIFFDDVRYSEPSDLAKLCIKLQAIGLKHGKDFQAINYYHGYLNETQHSTHHILILTLEAHATLEQEASTLVVKRKIALSADKFGALSPSEVEPRCAHEKMGSNYSSRISFFMDGDQVDPFEFGKREKPDAASLLTYYDSFSI